MATTDHGHKAGTEVPGGAHAKGPFPPFDPATFAPQLIWLALVFGDLDDAAQMQQKAQTAGLAYDKMLGDAKAKAQTMAQQMRDQLAAEANAKRKTIEDELNTKLSEAERGIAATKAQAMSHVTEIATSAAADIVAHLTGKPADAQQIAQAIAAAKA
jgi:F-type H+-transporting ATPase subunit b